MTPWWVEVGPTGTAALGTHRPRLQPQTGRPQEVFWKSGPKLQNSRDGEREAPIGCRGERLRGTRTRPRWAGDDGAVESRPRKKRGLLSYQLTSGPTVVAASRGEFPKSQ